MAEYEIWLTNDTGSRLMRVQPYWFQATRITNDIGTCQLGVHPDFDPDWLQRDYMLQFWRQPTGGRLGLFRTYFLRQWRWDLIGEQETLRLYGRDMNDLLRRRIIAYDASESQSEISATEADDAMKRLVDENMVTDASSYVSAGSRDYANLTVAGDLTNGPQLTKAFAWRRLLDVLQDLASAADTAGTRVYYDVVEADVSSATLGLQFRTYAGQPGADLTDLGVVFSPERGNFTNCYLEYDYGDEENYIYGLGQGENDDREIQESYSAADYNASAWNRCEGTINSVLEDSAAGVLDQADSKLQERLGRVDIGGELRDSVSFRFQRDWNWGDVLRARYRSFEFDGLVTAVSLSVDGDGRETVAGRLEEIE